MCSCLRSNIFRKNLYNEGRALEYGINSTDTIEALQRTGTIKHFRRSENFIHVNIQRKYFGFAERFWSGFGHKGRLQKEYHDRGIEWRKSGKRPRCNENIVVHLNNLVNMDNLGGSMLAIIWIWLHPDPTPFLESQSKLFHKISSKLQVSSIW